MNASSQHDSADQQSVRRFTADLVQCYLLVLHKHTGTRYRTMPRRMYAVTYCMLYEFVQSQRISQKEIAWYVIKVVAEATNAHRKTNLDISEPALLEVFMPCYLLAIYMALKSEPGGIMQIVQNKDCFSGYIGLMFKYANTIAATVKDAVQMYMSAAEIAKVGLTLVHPDVSEEDVVRRLRNVDINVMWSDEWLAAERTIAEATR